MLRLPPDAPRPAVQSIAHLSDLHLGSSPQAEEGLRALLAEVDERQIGHVIVTGDVTHRGFQREAEAFFTLCGDRIARGEMTVLPGNHDRMNDDVARALMPGPRVQTAAVAGLSLVTVDSTADYNRTLALGHGELTREDFDAIDRALSAAPEESLRAVALHHHPVPLPHDGLGERLIGLVGLPWCEELKMGAALLEVLRDRCDLVLHGHRHTPSERLIFTGGPRPLAIFNAGRSPSLMKFRQLAVSSRSLAVEWVDVPRDQQRKAVQPARVSA